MKRFLFTGGGTGGHVSPNLAVASELSKRVPDAELLYVGARGKAEEAMVPRAWDLPGPWSSRPGRSMVAVRCRAFAFANPLAALRVLIELGLGVLKAILILLRFRPDAVMATGAFVSAPVLLAAKVLRALRLLRPRVVIHEANAVPGRMVRAAMGLADTVAVTGPGVCVPPEYQAKVRVVGFPVRDGLASGDPGASRAALGIPPHARVVFAFGGSQGARTINRALVDALPRLLAREDVWVLLGTGRPPAGGAYDGAADVEERLSSAGAAMPSGSKVRFKREVFIHDMASWYAAADLVVCRAGAGSLTEVCAAGRPAVVIPKSGVAGDHQAANAVQLEHRGAVSVIYERIDPLAKDGVPAVHGEDLADHVLALLDDQAGLARMSDAAREAYVPRSDELLVDLLTRGEASSADGAEQPHLPHAPDNVLAWDSGLLLRRLSQLRTELNRLTVDFDGGAEALAAHLEQARAERFDERVLARVQYKIDELLAAPGFVFPARGCRAAGLLRYAARAPVLLAYAAGVNGRGRYRCKPITRRDAFVGLGLLGGFDEEVRDVLVAGLSDPYFESRAAAAQAIGRLSRDLVCASLVTDEALADYLISRVCDRHHEVRERAVEALGEITPGSRVEATVSAFRRVYLDRVWKVRYQVVRAFGRMQERSLLEGEQVLGELSRVLPTSGGFTPHFSLKKALSDVGEAARAGEG
jgi:UDP-N-acetylglucosamine--N-acetylmuramyl-(pentapeptide) pyrophosphoryl-undecaprenol N-acetylglucosamine transferase